MSRRPGFRYGSRGAGEAAVGRTFVRRDLSSPATPNRPWLPAALLDRRRQPSRGRDAPRRAFAAGGVADRQSAEASKSPAKIASAELPISQNAKL